MDNKEELLPIVDICGNTIGNISRAEAHNGSKPLHPVVHLHIFNNKGELYLQRRPAWKEIQPSKWDTAVGGHIAYGETAATALKRETEEELGIISFQSEQIGMYVFESNIEKELIFVYKTTYNGTIAPNTSEVMDGRFWNIDEINQNMGQNIFTPNFESEYKKFFQCKQ